MKLGYFVPHLLLFLTWPTVVEALGTLSGIPKGNCMVTSKHYQVIHSATCVESWDYFGKEAQQKLRHLGEKRIRLRSDFKGLLQV